LFFLSVIILYYIGSSVKLAGLRPGPADLQARGQCYFNLIPDPYSSRRAYLESTGTNNMDQGSVVVLCRRSPSCSYM